MNNAFPMIIWGEHYFCFLLDKGKRTQLIKIKEIIVVEGKDDTIKIQQAVHADTIETNGSAINDKILAQIKHAQEKRGVIIFTDPDYPGERIRHIIDQAIPGCKHAFLAKEKAKANNSRNKSLGIEHASIKDIQEALQGVYEQMDQATTDIGREDLLRYGLIGVSGSNARRESLGKLLKIGHTNGKQLLKRLKMFNITKRQFEQAMAKVMKEEQHDN